MLQSSAVRTAHTGVKSLCSMAIRQDKSEGTTHAFVMGIDEHSLGRATSYRAYP